MEKIAQIIDQKNEEILRLNKELYKLKMYESAYNGLNKNTLELLEITKTKEKQINTLINMLEEFEGIGALTPKMCWTLQCKLHKIIDPDYKPLVDYPRHTINLGNGSFY
jgi:CRISPR/Cas system CMR-associated protein Cmr1 (group 7 of RAMP superfamily)